MKIKVLQRRKFYMRKRILILGLSAVCMFSFVACGNKETVMETTESTAENIVAENVEDTTASDETTTEEKKTTKKNTTEKVTKDDNKKTKEDSTTDSARTNANNSSANSNAGNSRTTENGRTNVNSNSGNSNTETSRTTESRTTENRTTTESRTENRTTEAPTTQHTHNWQPIVVHHEAVYETREIPAVVNHYFCRTCGRSYPTSSDDPCLYSGQCITNGTSCQDVISPAREERVLVRDAYDEVVGYRCSCGATK